MVPRAARRLSLRDGSREGQGVRDRIFARFFPDPPVTTMTVPPSRRAPRRPPAARAVSAPCAPCPRCRYWGASWCWGRAPSRWRSPWPSRSACGAELGLLGLVVPVVNGASTADSSAVFALPSLVIAFRILAGSFGSDGGVLEGGTAVLRTLIWALAAVAATLVPAL